MSFLDPNKFPFLKSLSDNWLAIRDEYDTISSKTLTWPEPIHNGLWSVFGVLFQNNYTKNKSLVPVTSSICDKIPKIQTYGFSILKPGCIIIPHIGYTNKVLRCHLGLYGNPEASITVSADTQQWVPGQLLVFDDTKLHSAKNLGNSNRVVLLLDFEK